MPLRETLLLLGRPLLLAACVALAQSCGNGVEPYVPGPGNADVAFADQGLFRLDPDALLPDGLGAHVTTDAAGNVWSTGTLYLAPSAVILRLFGNGTPDTTFGGTGYAIDPAEAPPDPLTPHRGRSGMAAAPATGGGAILIESTFGVPSIPPSASGISWGATRRIDARGGVDTSFGYAGEATAGLEPSPEHGLPDRFSVEDGIADSRGGVVFVYARTQFTSRTVLARIDADGQVDHEFAARASGALGCLSSYLGDPRIAVHPDGKLLVGGLASGRGVCLCRFNPDGVPDVGYGGVGCVQLDDPLLASDSIGVVGVFGAGDGIATLAIAKRAGDYPSVHSYVVVALTSQGAVDVARYDRGYAGQADSLIAQAAAVAVQADGKVLVAGFPGIGTAPSWQGTDRAQPRLARLGLDGRSDPTFGLGGQGYASLVMSGHFLDPAHVHVAGTSIFVAGTAARSLEYGFSGHRHLAVAKFVGR